MKERLARLPENIIAKAGYETILNYYQFKGFSSCSYAAEYKNKNIKRTIQVSHSLNELKIKTNENLCSEKWLVLHSQRVVEA